MQVAVGASREIGALCEVRALLLFLGRWTVISPSSAVDLLTVAMERREGHFVIGHTVSIPDLGSSACKRVRVRNAHAQYSTKLCLRAEIEHSI